MDRLKEILDAEVLKRDSFNEISLDKPDPMLVAREYKDEYISLICALFAYGNARLIVKFLSSLDFSLIDGSEEEIKKSLSDYYYRFQSSEDVINIFITLRRAKLEFSLEDIFLSGYQIENNILDGLNTLISKLLELNKFTSHGYQFLLGSPPTKKSKSAYKRWNMYLRWMVRSDKIDLGLWERVDQKDLLIPLDTHTFKVSRKLGLLERKSYDLKAVVELSQKLRSFDPLDPIKYDFALYRIGQEKQKI
jgi:uncharacterized protein (TIGR02757 family)